MLHFSLDLLRKDYAVGKTQEFRVRRSENFEEYKSVSSEKFSQSRSRNYRVLTGKIFAQWVYFTFCALFKSSHKILFTKNVEWCLGYKAQI